MTGREENSLEKMTEKAATLKPFHLDEARSGPEGSITEATFEKWKSVLVANIKKTTKWAPYVKNTATWDPALQHHAQTSAELGDNVEAVLTYIATYAPSSLFRDITKRSISLESILSTVRDWANLAS